MFGASKSSGFKPVPFGNQRRRKGVPRWLLILLAGMALGAAALYYVEQSLLPPRLSLPESLSLKNQFDEASKARDQMATQLAQATSQMKSAQAAERAAVEKMTAALNNVEPLKKDLDLFLKAIPPDPRGNSTAIRAGNFSAASGKLNYHVLFTRERASGEGFRGQAQLFVAGSRGGRDSTIALEPQTLAVDGYQHMSGVAALPDGFQPREVTVKLLKGTGGTLESLRVFRLL